MYPPHGLRWGGVGGFGGEALNYFKAASSRSEI